MKKSSALKKTVTAALCAALCVVLPAAFHAVPKAGKLISPMHLPVLLCGITCGAPLGLLCGLLGPLLSSMITGMPDPSHLPAMLAELACYGFVSGLMMRLVRTRSRVVNLYASLITAMLAGRIAAGLVKAVLFAPGKITVAIWATTYFIEGLPAIIIQLLLVPAVVFALDRAEGRKKK